jgi:hypothetical protein
VTQGASVEKATKEGVAKGGVWVARIATPANVQHANPEGANRVAVSLGFENLESKGGEPKGDIR